MSEIIDISPGNLDSSLCFLQPSISYDVLSAYKLNKQGDNKQSKEIEENNRMGKTRDIFKKIRDTKGTSHKDGHNREKAQK